MIQCHMNQLSSYLWGSSSLAHTSNISEWRHETWDQREWDCCYSISQTLLVKETPPCSKHMRALHTAVCIHLCTRTRVHFTWRASFQKLETHGCVTAVGRPKGLSKQLCVYQLRKAFTNRFLITCLGNLFGSSQISGFRKGFPKGLSKQLCVYQLVKIPWKLFG